MGPDRERSDVTDVARRILATRHVSTDYDAWKTDARFVHSLVG